jgi:hypothetical protein
MNDNHKKNLEVNDGVEKGVTKLVKFSVLAGLHCLALCGRMGPRVKLKQGRCADLAATKEAVQFTYNCDFFVSTTFATKP